LSTDGKTPWLDDGLQLLKEGGEAALTIERLCQLRKRTKGAFYHHFGDLDGYLDALLLHWETRNTEEPIRRAEREPGRRKQALDRAIGKLELRLDVAIRAWGLRDARARRALARVDARRLAYLTELRGGGVRARQLAELEYAAFVGSMQLFSDPFDQEGRKRYALLERALASV
jgi:AcrR family transcriptional regulator